MVWGVFSLPVKDTVRLVGGVIKAEYGYKRGIYLDEEENSDPPIPQLLLGEFALFCYALAHVVPFQNSYYLFFFFFDGDTFDGCTLCSGTLFSQ